MKRCILILFLLMLSLAASAQYVHRRGGHMTRDKEKIALEEQQLILSDINGIDYNGVWKDYNGWRKTGLGLTIGGSVVAGGGALTFLTGALVSMLGAAVGAVGGAAVGGSVGGSAGAQSGAQAGAEAGVKAGQPIMTGGLIAMGVGAVALGAGIPVLVVNCKRMNRIVADYNGTLPDPTLEEPAVEEPAVEVAFGPAPSGIGFTVSF